MQLSLGKQIIHANYFTYAAVITPQHLREHLGEFLFEMHSERHKHYALHH